MSRVQLRRSAGSRRLGARGPRAAAPVAGAILCALIAAGCGAGRQDAKEPSGTYTVAVTNASFPARQAIAKPTKLMISVRNNGSRTLPDVAVTVDSLTYRATHPPKLADPERPTWIIYTGPGKAAGLPVESEEITRAGGAETANTHTWALGRLSPGETKTFVWKLMPVISGTKTIHYSIAAGLNGKAKAQFAGGSSPTGTLTVHVAQAPPTVHVNPVTGAVEQGAYPVSSGPVGAVP